MEPYRVYIDESGDQSYKITTHPSTRFLGLTALVVESDYYTTLHDDLAALKRAHFRFEPDGPPVVLTRRHIIDKKGPFGVLVDPVANARWEDALVAFFASRNPRVKYFTVVADKEVHKQKFGRNRFDPYDYALAVLLNRIRGLLWNFRDQATASVIAESRGKTEDAQLQASYVNMRTLGSGERTATEYRATYPESAIRFRKKSEDISGLQVADLLAANQKEKVISAHGLPLTRPISPFAQRLNTAVAPFVNDFGKYLLE